MKKIFILLLTLYSIVLYSINAINDKSNEYYLGEEHKYFFKASDTLNAYLKYYRLGKYQNCIDGILKNKKVIKLDEIVYKTSISILSLCYSGLKKYEMGLKYLNETIKIEKKDLKKAKQTHESYLLINPMKNRLKSLEMEKGLLLLRSNKKLDVYYKNLLTEKPYTFIPGFELISLFQFIYYRVINKPIECESLLKLMIEDFSEPVLYFFLSETYYKEGKLQMAKDAFDMGNKFLNKQGFLNISYYNIITIYSGELFPELKYEKDFSKSNMDNLKIKMGFIKQRLDYLLEKKNTNSSKEKH